VIFRDLSFANSEHFSTLIVIKKMKVSVLTFEYCLLIFPTSSFVAVEQVEVNQGTSS